MTPGRPTGAKELSEMLSAHRERLESFGVARLSVFGSLARQQQDPLDVDLLVEFKRPVGLFEFVRLKRELAEIVGCSIDLATTEALKPRLRDRILGEAVPVFSDTRRSG